MPFAAKSAVPNDADAALRQPVVEQAAEGGMTLFTAPAGYLLTGGLAAVLDGCGRSVSWLRLGPEDRDPAVLLLSLMASEQRMCPGLGTATLSQMRRRPGPLEGWPRLFEHLGRELAEALPTSSAIVFEHVHYLNDVQPTLALLGHYILPALRSDVVCILASHDPLPPAALPARTAYRGVNDLRLADHAALGLLERAEAKLPTALVYRANTLVGGRAGVLADLFSAVALLGRASVQQAVERATSLEDLLTRVARAWLTTVDAETLQAIALATRLEFSHPALIQAAIGNTTTPAGPWLQPLAENWTRVRRVWLGPLRTLSQARSAQSGDVLRRAADYLIDQGAIEQAVPLYFDIGDAARAAQAIASAADAMMNLGQWETLGNWLNRLPAPTLNAWPRLVCTAGEIAAAQGQTDVARRTFETATALCAAHHDADGACRSMLAESVLAAWHGERAHAQARALAAHTMAEANGLVWHQAWAAWQLGCLAAAAGALDDCLVYFDQAAAAASAASDTFFVELLREVEALARQQRELRRQREFHRQAYFAAERAEHEADERLRTLLSAPSDSLDDLLGAYGWSRTPLMLKLPASQSPAEMPDIPKHSSLWNMLLGALGLGRRPTEPAAMLAAARVSNLPRMDASPPAVTAALGSSPLPAAPTGDVAVASAVVLAPPSTERTEGAAARTVEKKREERDMAALAVYCLGPCRIYLDDKLITNWPGRKGKVVFKYMVANRGRPIAKDVLMDLFWRDADPEAARNNLNVAIHGLRQGFRAVRPDFSCILFEDDHYLLNPAMAVWVDIEEFVQHYEAGQSFERKGRLSEAMREYGIAESLYQGDFFEEDLYEDWPIPRRESLKDNYLIVLDRLSRYALEAKGYTSCIQLCQKLLAKDDCREDAHRRLMLCYSRQGQPNLALRQYHVCVEALARVLDVSPMQETVALYHQIRNGEAV